MIGKLYNKRIITCTILTAMACPVYAAVPPDSGTALEGTKPPAVERSVQKVPRIIVEDHEPVVSAEGQQKIMVNSFRIGGEPPLPTDELLDLIRKEGGRELSLNEINKLAGKITKHLREKGYLVAFAYIPAQDIEDGVVEIDVVPGKYNLIKITGDGHIDADRLKSMLFVAKPGMLITRAPLERALLLINDLSGVSVKATLIPGEITGTADLLLETADTSKTSGAVYADNWGNRFTGRTRYGTQLTVNNFSNNGDTFNLGGLTTFNGINNYNFGYSAQLGHDGAKAEIRYSHVGYTLGDTFANLGATGRAAVTSYDITYPFIRSRVFNLYGSVGYDNKHLQDDNRAASSYSPRTSSLWNVGLSGSFADNWGGGGTNDFALTYYQGNLRFNDSTAAANDAADAQTSGIFCKTVFTYQRQQYVVPNLNFNLSFTGQLADKNLDSSEKLFLGGADGVRAYSQGEASGDQGYKLTGEFRWHLPGMSRNQNNLYLNTFYDYGSVRINKRSYSTDANRRSLMGVGLGFLWTRDKDFAIRMDYAWKIGSEQATDDDKSGRFWLQAVKYF